MSATALKVLGRTTIAAGTAGSIMWINHQASTLPEDRRGPLVDRCLDTVSSTAQSVKVYGKLPSIEHLKLITSLPSEEYAKINVNLLDQELTAARASYFAGYFADVDTRCRNIRSTRLDPSGENTDMHIFKLSSDLPLSPPGKPYRSITHTEVTNLSSTDTRKYFPGHKRVPSLYNFFKSHKEPHSGFIYAGKTDQLSPDTRKDFLNHNYVRCPASLSNVFKPHQEHLLSSIATQEVLITGTKDGSKCHRFREVFLRDIVHAAATEKGIDPLHPLSDTLVYEQTSSGSIKLTGDLTDLSPSAKQQIRLNKFQEETYVTKSTTRLSQTEKEIGAVIVQTEDNPISPGDYNTFLHDVHFKK